MIQIFIYFMNIIFYVIKLLFFKYKIKSHIIIIESIIKQLKNFFY